MFYIGSEQHYLLFQRTADILQHQLKFNICNLKSSHQLNDEVEDLKEKIDRNISEELGYSARYWMYHMINSGDWTSSHDSILELLESGNTMLYWTEVLSLLGCVRKIMLEMTEVIEWIKRESKCRVQLEEIRTFLDKFITPISQSACHVYTSALSFVPERTWLAKQFWKNFEQRVAIFNTKDQNWQKAQSYTRVLNGHSGFVFSVAFSSDNRYVVSGSADNTVTIWDVETGQQRAKFQGHTNRVTSTAFSSDDKYVASGSYDNTVRIWGVETGQPKAEFQGHTDEVTSVAFFSDNKYVV
ncbi:WD40 repeat-like protein, partial [Pluteus cervinus]